MRFFVTFLFLCFLSTSTVAQQAKQYSFTHFTTANGLASNLVNSIVQDEEGFLWFGTTTGLSRYDGYRFLNFSHPRNSAFPFDNIAVLHYDTNHNIWIVTAESKVGIFNPRDFTFREVDAKALEKNAYQQISFLETGNGTILLQEFMGNTCRYDEAQNKLVIDTETVPAPKGWHLTRIAWDAVQRKYWMGADSGMAVYNPASKQLSYRGHNIENDPVIAHYNETKNILYITLDKDRNIIFHNWPYDRGTPYLQSYNRKTGESVQVTLSEKMPIGYHEIGECLQQRNGRMWIYGHPILAEWLPDRKHFVPVVNEYRTEQSIRFDYVRACFEDGEQNVWVATDNGLYLFNPDAQLFNTYNFTYPNDAEQHEFPATTMLQAQDSTVYVGTWGTGLFMYDKTINPVPVPKVLQTLLRSNHSIWDIHQHSKTGKIWITLQGGELIVYDPKTGAAKKYTPHIFENSTIRQLTEDRNGNLWFGTHKGAIIKWNYKQAGGDPAKSYTSIHKTGMVLKLLADSSGYIWAATFAYGLLKFDAEKDTLVQAFTKENPKGQDLVNNVVTDVMQYNDSLLIAVTNSLNLVNLHTGRISHITTAEGLPSNTGVCLAKDRYGILWLGLQNGLCRINLQKHLFNLYDRRHGIIYDNFNPAGAFHLRDDHIAFTTDHNFLAFDPNHFIYESSIPPDPDFSSFTLSDASLSLDSLLRLGKAVLNYNNNAFTIAFSVMSFLKQKQPDYYYILENFDKNWTKTAGNNQAIYSYLPPGHYTFRVKAVNQDGVFSRGGAVMEIEIRPPFWRTWWFYGLIALLGIAVLYQIDKERQHRRQALQTVRTQIAGDLHDEINTTLHDINLLSEIAKLKADKDIDRSKDYIDQISTKSRTMIESMDDILWSIHPENDSMQRMLLRIYEFTDGIKKTANLEVELTVDKEVERQVMDMKMRHEFLLFYKDAVVYVVQHSVCSTIYISLEYLRGKLSLKILAQCNQLEELPPATAQLEYGMQRRADALDGLLDIMSDHKSISIILQVAV